MLVCEKKKTVFYMLSKINKKYKLIIKFVSFRLYVNVNLK